MHIPVGCDTITTRGKSCSRLFGAVQTPANGSAARWLLGLPVIALVCGTASAQCPPAVLNTPNTILASRFINDHCRIVQPSGSLTIAAPATVTVSGSIRVTNENLFINNGGYRNFGIFINNASGTATNVGTFTNSGGFDNAGGFDNDGTLLNNGAAGNRGSLRNGGSLVSNGDLFNSGTLENRGSLVSNADVLNSGTWESRGAQTSNARFDHRAGATLTVSGTLTNARTGQLTGEGAETGALPGAAISVVAGGTLNNDGTLTIGGAIAAEGAGATLTSTRGSVNNAGRMVVGPGLGSFSTGGNFTSWGGALNNAAGGTITIDAFATMAVQPDFDTGAFGSTVNAGAILNHGFLGLSGEVSNTGSITNRFSLVTGSAVISNAGVIVNWGLLSNNAILRNTGGGVLNNSFHELWNAGELRNEGGVGPGAPGAVMNNEARFWNRAFFENGTGVSGGDAAVFHNRGTIDNDEGAEFISRGSIESSGVIRNAGVFTIAKTGIVTGPGAYHQMAGMLTVDGDMSQGLVDCAGGDVYGADRITAATLQIGAGCTVHPGSSPGILTLDGGAAGVDFDGLLEIEIESASVHDILRVLSGGIHFGPDARVLFLFDGYAPAAGDTFEFLEGFADGTFAASFAGLPAGYDFELVRGADGGFGLRTVSTPDPGTLPSPATLPAALLALAAMAAARARRPDDHADAACTSGVVTGPVPL